MAKFAKEAYEQACQYATGTGYKVFTREDIEAYRELREQMTQNDGLGIRALLDEHLKEEQFRFPPRKPV